MIKLINESNSLSDFRGNSRFGHATRVRIKATGRTGWVESVVDDKWSQGIRVVYDDRPGMWPDFFTVDEVEIIEPVKKPKTESFDDDFEQYTYVKSKDVNDADGYLTEYTMYYDEVEDKYVFVFGDSDIYNPNDGYEEFDYECDTEREADEWFDNYEGFADLDEGLRKSTKLKEGLRYFVTDADYIPLKAQPNEGYTELQAVNRAQREAERSAKLFNLRVSETAKWYHIMDSNNKIRHDLDNAI